MDINELSNCDSLIWNANFQKVVPGDFVPVEIRVMLFREVFCLCDDMGLRVWLNNGTLLSAIREGVFIEDDDDIDLAMMEGDFIKVMSVLKEKFILLGYIVRLVDKNNPKMSFYKKGYKITIVGLKTQGSWLTRPVLKYPKKLLDNDLFINFYDVRCLIPNPPEEYLEHIYGSDWKIPYKGKNKALVKGIDWGYHSLNFLNYRSVASYYIALKIILKKFTDLIS
jgi:hypothetical protein